MGAGFCGACGNALKEGAKFCAACGAPTAVSGAEAQGSSYQPGAAGYKYSQNKSSYQHPVRKKSSHSALGVIVALVLVLAAAFGVMKLFKIEIPGLKLPFIGDNSGKDTTEDISGTEATQDNSGKDITLKEMAGVWTGTMQYDDIKNLEKAPGITEEEIKSTREMFGEKLPFSISIDEAGMSVLTVTGVDGSKSDIAELPAIVLENGKFTVTFGEDNNKFVFDGVVTEKGKVMNLEGGMTMYLDTGDGTMVTFIMSYSVSK